MTEAPSWDDLEQRVRILRCLEATEQSMTERRKLLEGPASLSVRRTNYLAALAFGLVGAFIVCAASALKNTTLNRN